MARQRRAQAPAGARYSGREMPSFFIFQYNIERFIPRRAAAPFGPPTTQPVSRRAPRMCSRSASASVRPGWRAEVRRRRPRSDVERLQQGLDDSDFSRSLTSGL